MLVRQLKVYFVLSMQAIGTYNYQAGGWQTLSTAGSVCSTTSTRYIWYNWYIHHHTLALVTPRTDCEGIDQIIVTGSDPDPDSDYGEIDIVTVIGHHDLHSVTRHHDDIMKDQHELNININQISHEIVQLKLLCLQLELKSFISLSIQKFTYLLFLPFQSCSQLVSCTSCLRD